MCSCTSYIATCPPYMEAATLDMVQAYRNSPIIPEHKKYLAVCWQDEIYIQHNAVEGLSSAGGIQGMPADACIKILRANDISPMFMQTVAENQPLHEQASCV